MGNANIGDCTEDLSHLYNNSFNHDEFDNLNIKKCPILFKTQRPVVYSTFCFGGFDFLAFIESYVEKENPYFNELQILKQRYIDGTYNCIDEIEAEYKILTDRIYSETKEKNLDNPEFKRYLDYFLKQTDKNRASRIKIIDALGGVETCSLIYVCDFGKDHLNEYIYLPNDVFPDGVSIIQFEDYAGRKGLAFKVKNKSDKSTKILVCHQRYRETTISGLSNDGDWIFGSDWGVDNACQEIKSILDGSHKYYDLCV